MVNLRSFCFVVGYFKMKDSYDIVLFILGYFQNIYICFRLLGMGSELLRELWMICGMRLQDTTWITLLMGLSR